MRTNIWRNETRNFYSTPYRAGLFTAHTIHRDLPKSLNDVLLIDGNALYIKNFIINWLLHGCHSAGFYCAIRLYRYSSAVSWTEYTLYRDAIANLPRERPAQFMLVTSCSTYADIAMLHTIPFRGLQLLVLLLSIATHGESSFIVSNKKQLTITYISRCR